MENSIGARPSTSRRRISSLVHGHSDDTDAVCVIDHDKYVYISRNLGAVFSFPTSFVVNDAFPIKRDCGLIFSRLLADASIASQHRLKTTDSSSKQAVTKQANMFVTMIQDVLNSTPEETSALLPSLHALQHCLRSGWQPDEIPQGVIELALRLVAEKVPTRNEEAATAAVNLLNAAMKSSSAISFQVLLALLSHYVAECASTAEPATEPLPLQFEDLLNSAICQYMQKTFNFLLSQAAKESLQAESNTQGSDVVQMIRNLALGDTLEIQLGGEWLSGTIVRSNALTGELHIEHSKSPGIVATAGRGAPATALTVTVLPKNSTRLRVPPKASADRNTSAEPSATTRNVTVANVSVEEATARLAAFAALVFGEEVTPVPTHPRSLHPGTSQQRTISGLNPLNQQQASADSFAALDVDAPLCENNHRCSVVVVPATSPGFACFYCGRLYPSGHEPLADASLSSIVLRARGGGTKYKWWCAECHCDVCLACFPHPAYPKDGTCPLSEIAARVSGRGTPRRTTPTSSSSSRMDRSAAGRATDSAAPASGKGVGVPCTICLMGTNESSYCKVRAEPSVHAAEVSRVSHGSVIDVIDFAGSDFFQLVSSPGFVKKQPGRLGLWKRLPKDRYMLYEEENVSIFSGEIELSTPSMGAEDAERELGCVTTSAVAVVVALLRYDEVLKARFAAFIDDRGQDAKHGGKGDLERAQMAVLEGAKALFAKTAIPMGEMVTATVDCFEDSVDDHFISSERVVAPTVTPDANAVATGAVPTTPGRYVAALLPAAPQRDLAALLAGLQQPDMKLRERLSVFVVNDVFALICELMTALAERRISHQDAAPTAAESLAMDLLALLAHSEHHQVLNAFYYRVMIAHAGLRCKLYIRMFLNREVAVADSVQPIIDAFAHLATIESAYKSVIVLPACAHTSYFEKGLTDKLRSTLQVVGYTGLANGVVEKYRRTASKSSGETQSGFKSALQRHILQPRDRFAPPSRAMRRCLKLLCQYGSEDSVSVLEGLWREVIADMVHARCTESQRGTGLFAENHAHLVEARSEGLVDYLITTLSDTRYVSKMDMAVTKQCCMSAEIAFVTAFRRLPKEKALELTKALVVRISSLIDSHKAHAMSRAWAQSLDAITDLIQVLFAQASTEFQHFYELLLARRLLRNRYISLSIERRVLGQLPALSKSMLMIRDIEQASVVMHSFRNYLVERMDFQDVQVSQDTVELALSGDRLTVNVLTGDVWPSLWLQPLAYAQLRLPTGMELLKREFIRYFDAQDTNRFDSLKLLERFPSLEITGSEENVSRINGIYDPTLEMCDGWPVYEMRESSSCSILEYSAKTSSWHIKKRTDRGKNAGWAYCKSPAKTPPEQVDKPWFVWKKAQRKWLAQPIKIVTVPTASRSGDHYQPQGTRGASSNSAINDGPPRPRPLRKLVWCHAAGTITLQAHLHGDKTSHLIVTEAQAALLYAFNQSDHDGKSERRTKRSIGELQAALNLTVEETRALVLSLARSQPPILALRSPTTIDELDTSSEVRLAPQLLSGALGGADIDRPIVLSSAELDKQHDDASLASAELHSLHGWRNELIDACIVRILKYTAAHKAGEFPNQFRQRFTALPVDTLTFQVRTALKGHCTVSAEDVLRRSERLVSIGVIDKVVGNADIFRSVAYCYLSESVAPVVSEDDGLIRENYICDKVYGQDLFNHLRIVLGIRTLPADAPGISLALFKEKFLAWMMCAQCELVCGPDGRPYNLLDLVPGILLELCVAAVTQANALKLQLWHGVHNLSGAMCPPNTFYTLKGMESMQVMTSVLRTGLSNGSPNVHNYLCLDRVYFEHCPPQLVQDVLNYFRSTLGEPIVHYSNDAKGGSSSQLTGPRQNGGNGSSAKKQTLAGGDEDFAVDVLPVDDVLTSAGITVTEEHAGISASDTTLSRLKHEIQALWHRSGMIRKQELIHAFGLPESLLMSMGLLAADSQGDEKPTPSESKRSDSGAKTGSTPIRDSPAARWRENRAGSLQAKDSKHSAAPVFVKITLQQLVSAVLLTASEKLRAESTLTGSGKEEGGVTFAQFLDDQFFHKLVDAVAQTFGTELRFAGEGEAVGSGDAARGGETMEEPQEREEEEEVYIPCEFCTDSIRMSLFAAHTIACQAGRALPASLRGREDGRDNRKAPAEAKEAPPAVVLESRPSALSPLGVSFVEGVLNALVAAAADLQIPPEDYSAAVAHKASQRNFTAFLEQLFSQLDRDGDGFITATDFAVVERSYVDLRASVDPSLLYGARSSLNSFFPSQQSVFARKLPPVSSVESLAEEDLQELSTPIALGKVSSLWRSVSHEKSLPIADASRSYAGLEEAELELNAMVRRVMSIIDDSEGTSLSMLVHYKWDVKRLVEDVIENSRAVRFAVGLAPRSMPPFLRHDLFGSHSNAASRSPTPQQLRGASPSLAHFTTGGGNEGVLCGICQDTVPPNEAFALHCRHWHCEGCWQGFIHNAINDRLVTYHCPQPGCKCLVTPDMQKFFADDAHLHDAKGVLIKSFVEDRRGEHVLATYCKNPRGCDGIVLLADDADYSEACCSLCATTFCAACDMPPHAPATCDMVAKWEEKGGYIETGRAEDVEARKLKHLTTKPCPKCGVRIEKSGGCPHMTCVQPSCKYQFCWECAGEYHTSTTCSRPKVKLETNAVLAFDEYDRQCANHFLARKVALKGKQTNHKLLEQSQRPEEAAALRVMEEGWSVLADAQSALAHACIVMLNVRSAKLSFLFDCQKAQAVALQQKFEEIWTSVDTFPLVEAKAAIRDLRVRLRDFLLTAHAEIIVERSVKSTRPKSAPRGLASPTLGRSPARGALSNAASPSGRRSAPSTKMSAVEDQVSAEDRPLLELLQQHQHSADSDVLGGEPLTSTMMVEVASTVFGDALGGSWRTYRPFDGAVAVTTSGQKGTPASQVKMPSIAPSSSPRMPPPPPVRAFAGITPLSFSPNPTRQQGGEEGAPALAPPAWFMRSPAEAAEADQEDELSGQTLNGFEWAPRGDSSSSSKRPRK